MSIRSDWSIVSFKVCVSLLVFRLVDLSIGVSVVLKSPTIIVLLLISPFKLVSICLTYCGAPMLGTYIFMIVISFSWIDPLIIMYCPSVSCFTAFVLKSIFSGLSIATPAFFGLYLREVSFSGPSLSLCMCPLFRGGSLVDNIYRGLFLYPFSQSLSFGWGIQPIYIYGNY